MITHLFRYSLAIIVLSRRFINIANLFGCFTTERILCFGRNYLLFPLSSASPVGVYRMMKAATDGFEPVTVTKNTIALEVAAQLVEGAAVLVTLLCTPPLCLPHKCREFC